MRVPKLPPLPGRPQQPATAIPDGLVYAGAILLIATLTAVLTDPPVRAVVVVAGIIAALACVWIGARASRGAA